MGSTLDLGISCSDAAELECLIGEALDGARTQLAAEAYQALKSLFKVSHDEMRTVFADWNKGELADPVMRATADALGLRDEDGLPLLEKVLDATTGPEPCARAAALALQLGVPAGIFAQAASFSFASAMKDERIDASALLAGPKPAPAGERHAMCEELRRALVAAFILAYTQAFLLLGKAAAREGREIDLAAAARRLGGGAFIPAKAAEAFERDGKVCILVLDAKMKALLDLGLPSLRKACARCAEAGLPAPALSSALAFYDSCRSAWLPANLLCALRDSASGAGYERVDRPRGEVFHSEWR